ncbi:exonuclease domain-containing protein [Marinilabilia rubra]|nr:exonuclease domain-containing protein [Marinilabilia rubra]
MNQLPKYSVIDVETTGGKAGVGRITEIAVYLMEGEEIIDKFVSLVNPECYIPPYISRLTGITNEMVAEAPRFFEIAKKVVEITEDSVFVAHNAPFDYSFVKKEFEGLGYDYNREVMCTVRLSRKVIPGHRSYSLGQLCQELRIPLSDRHRAGGDAHATALLLRHLFEIKGDFILPEDDLDLKGINAELDMKKIRRLPETPGIYFFHNANNEVIYIGKSRNVRKRVLSHLGAKGKRGLRMKEQLTDVSYEVTGSELVALLRESDEIKEQKPLFNRAGRKTRFNWGVFSFKDQKGYYRFLIDRVNSNTRQPLDAFSSKDNAVSMLSNWVEKYELCRQLCGLENKQGPCFNYSVDQCKGACTGEEPSDLYNKRVQQMIDDLNFSSPNFVIFDEGRKAGEKSFVWIEKNVLRGFGWLSEEDTITHPSELEGFVVGGVDNRDTRQIVRSYLVKKSSSRVKILKY